MADKEEIFKAVTLCIEIIVMLVVAYLLGYSIGQDTMAKTRYAEAYEGYAQKLEERKETWSTRLSTSKEADAKFEALLEKTREQQEILGKQQEELMKQLEEAEDVPVSESDSSR